jgi:hypothetical protein
LACLVCSQCDAPSKSTPTLESPHHFGRFFSLSSLLPPLVITLAFPFHLPFNSTDATSGVAAQPFTMNDELMQICSVGGNPVSAFLSWRLQATNACDVTLVWKSGYEHVSQYGISFK